MIRRQQRIKNNNKKVATPRYKKEKKINSGSYGQVFIAWDTVENRKVVMKQVETRHYVELLKEIHFLRGLHLQAPQYFPDIIQVIHDGNNHQLMMIMEYFPWTLDDLMSHDSDNIYLITIFQQLLEAYVIMESHMIGHFDLKPDNILIHWPENSELPVIKIIDLGFSEYYSNQPRKPYICTDYYRPPEIFGDSDKVYGYEVDLWSIGVILHEYFLNKHVFRGETEEDVLKDIHNKMPLIDYQQFWNWHPDLGFVIQSFLNYDVNIRVRTYLFLRPYICENLKTQAIFPRMCPRPCPSLESESVLGTERIDRYHVLQEIEKSDRTSEFSEFSESFELFEVELPEPVPEIESPIPVPETESPETESPETESPETELPETIPEPFQLIAENYLLDSPEEINQQIEDWMMEAESILTNCSESSLMCPTNLNCPESCLMCPTNCSESSLMCPTNCPESISTEPQYYLLFPLPTFSAIQADYLVFKHIIKIVEPKWCKILLNALDTIESLEEPESSTIAWSAFYRIITRYLNSLKTGLSLNELQLAVSTSLFIVSQIYYYRPLKLSDFLELGQIYLGWRFKSHTIKSHEMRLIKFI